MDQTGIDDRPMVERLTLHNRPKRIIHSDGRLSSIYSYAKEFEIPVILAAIVLQLQLTSRDFKEGLVDIGRRVFGT